MFVLTCDITIGQYRFNQVNQVKIEKSWRNLDDKATLKLPRASKLLEKSIKVGDPVSITLAYDGYTPRVEFEGYVKKIKPKVPLEIECEDPTHLLRQTHIKAVWKEPTSVKSVVDYIISKVNEQNPNNPITLSRDIGKINLAKYRISGVSAAEAINKLKENYGLAAYFTGHQLYIGMAFSELSGRVGYDMGKNVIKNDLTFRKAEDVKIKVKATSILKDNTHFSIEAGDEGGDERTLFFHDITEKKELREQAENKLATLKFDGYEGHITSFLIPYAQPGMTAVVTDPEFAKLRDGSYMIDSVTTTFGTRGARRKVELGVLLAKKENNGDEN